MHGQQHIRCISSLVSIGDTKGVIIGVGFCIFFGRYPAKGRAFYLTLTSGVSFCWPWLGLPEVDLLDFVISQE